MPKMGELKRATLALGVTSTTLRQQGWRTASPARIKAVQDDPPQWLVAARERRRDKRSRQQAQRDRRTTAARLGIQMRAVTENDLMSGDVAGLLAAPPDWLSMEQDRRQAQIDRETKDKLRADLSDALVISVHEVWLQELKYATTDADADEVDGRWASEVDRAKREARKLVDELDPDQVRASLEREKAAAHVSAVYRAGQLARQVFGDQRG